MRTTFLSGIALLSIALSVVDTCYAFDAWHLDHIYTLAMEQLDPVVSPNRQAGHMHRIIGGSKFGASYNFEEQTQSSCSSLSIQADKSNYWAPQLYWINKGPDNTTSFQTLPMWARMYYFLLRDSSSVPIAPFPKGLKILTGNPNAKTKAQSGPVEVLEYDCFISADFTQKVTSDNFNFDRDCPYGMRANIRFPPCWDGVNLYKTDNSHMAWPNLGWVNGICPWTHPIRLPGIMLEYIWSTRSAGGTQPTKGNIAWANGDTTGYGGHADFINGWNMDVLRAALDDPTCTGKGTEAHFESCATLKPHHDIVAASKCLPEKGLLEEPCGTKDMGRLSTLPGCNPIWSDGPKPACNPAVAPLSMPASLIGSTGSLVAPASDQTGFKWPLKFTGDWSLVGCFQSIIIQNPRTFLYAKATQEGCQSLCAQSGFRYAGLDISGESARCQCGNSVASAAGLQRNCNVPCSGNSTQVCGAVNSVILFGRNPQLPASTPPPSTNGTRSLGCFQPNSSQGLASNATYKFGSGLMTNAICIAGCQEKGLTWAATTKSTECYCGRSLDTSIGIFVSPENCWSQCAGNKSESCGGFYPLNVFALSSVSATAPPSGSLQAGGLLGCFDPASSAQPLNGYYAVASDLTADTCKNACSQMSFSIAGIKAGNQCWCGNTWQGGKDLPSNQCQSPCSGNSTQYCGGSSGLQLYNSSAAIYGLAAAQQKNPPGWRGCYSSKSTTPVLTDYSFYFGALKVEHCTIGCAYFGYAYAGLQMGTCYCSSSMKATTVQPTTLCNFPCTGNSSQSCGSANFMDIYSTSGVQVPTYSNLNPPGWQGCYNMPAAGSFGSDSWVSGSMTGPGCSAGCASLGFGVAAIQNGNMCSCSNSLPQSTQLPPDICSVRCSGNATQTCGGPYSQLTIYNATAAGSAPTKPTGWKGCYNASLAFPSSYYSGDMTSALCRRSCANQGYSLAATQDGYRCLCGNALTDVPLLAASRCNVACRGNVNETCGSFISADVYDTRNASAPAGVPGYEGCFNDIPVLNGFTYQSGFLSPLLCAQSCSARGFRFSGTRYGRDCLCGNTAPKELVSTAKCSTPCQGFPNDTCGGNNGLLGSVYNNAGLILSKQAQNSTIPVTSTVNGYLGCFTESRQGQSLLGGYSYSSNSMTNQGCMATCNSKGYKLAGTEIAGICHCGNDFNYTLSAGSRLAETACSVPCYGNRSEFCGDWTAVSVYDAAVKLSSSSIILPTSIRTSSSVISTISGNSATTSVVSAPDVCAAALFGSSSSIRSVASSQTGPSQTLRSPSSSIQSTSSLPVSSTQKTTSTQLAEPFLSSTTSSSVPVIANHVALAETSEQASRKVAATFALVGCLLSHTSEPINQTYISSNRMTADVCSSWCGDSPYFALVDGNSCYCAGSLGDLSNVMPDLCNLECSGDASTICGGQMAMSVYKVLSQGQFGKRRTASERRSRTSGGHISSGVGRILRKPFRLLRTNRLSDLTDDAPV